jgi:TRAP-type C4-dicarboxylate transport system permease large subunit
VPAPKEALHPLPLPASGEREGPAQREGEGLSLFMAGVAPGLFLGTSLVVLCLVLAYRDGHPRGETMALREAVKIAIDALWGLVTLAIILGGILGEVFTAIEAGAVACLWAFFVTMFIYRDYRWRELPQLVHRTMRTVAMVMTLIAFGGIAGLVSSRRLGGFPQFVVNS